MLLLFRFLLIVLQSRFRSRIGALDESKVRFTVLPTDCDLNVHLNAGRYLSFMDISRMELLGRMRALLPLIRRRWKPLLGGCVVRYRREIKPFERFDVRTRLVGWDEKWLYLEHVCERDGQFAAHSYARMLFRSPTGNIPPATLVETLAHRPIAAPTLPDFVLRWREAEDAR